jgi:hypothetical protein
MIKMERELHGIVTNQYPRVSPHFWRSEGEQVSHIHAESLPTLPRSPSQPHLIHPIRLMSQKSWCQVDHMPQPVGPIPYTKVRISAQSQAVRRSFGRNTRMPGSSSPAPAILHDARLVELAAARYSAISAMNAVTFCGMAARLTAEPYSATDYEDALIPSL